MTRTEKRLRDACAAYWRHRNTPGEYALLCARERLSAVSEAYRNGWTREMVEIVDGEVHGEVCR